MDDTQSYIEQMVAGATARAAGELDSDYDENGFDDELDADTALEDLVPADSELEEIAEEEFEFEEEEE
jgi:hypothetical protein